MQTFDQESKKIVYSAWVSVGMSILILFVKFYAYYQTKSQAVLSDALESIVNVIASALALIILKAVSEPADKEHPYGHGKLEYFSSAFEGGLIAFAALVIGFTSIQSAIHQEAPREIDTGLIIMVIAGFLNFLLGMHLLSVGKRRKSEALIASAKHVFSDAVTTVGVIIGLGLVRLTGIIWFDTIAAIIVALHLLNEGIKIVRRSIGGLIDEMDQKTLNEFAALFSKYRQPGMIDIHHLKLIRSGRFHHIDGHLVVPEFWEVSRAHQVNDDFEEVFLKNYPYLAEVAFHIDPCGRVYCEHCDLKDCPVRQKQFNKLKDFTADSLVNVPLQDIRGIYHHD